MNKLLSVLNRNKTHLLEIPGVVSVGIGPKHINSKETNQLSLIIGVEKKEDLNRLYRTETIPSLLRDIPTDIMEIGKVSFQGFSIPNQKKNCPNSNINLRKNKMRPAVPGISIGHHQITAGTFGAVIYGDFPQGMALLSNNHIFANGSNGIDKLARVGDPIFQPGPFDGGCKNDVIAQLFDFVPYQWISVKDYQNGKRPTANLMDAAIATPIDIRQIKNNVFGLGEINGNLDPIPGMIVMKSGRSTGITRGKVISIHNTLYLEDNERAFLFEEQFATSPMSDNGDSGSLIMNQNGKAVGLLFAGSARITYATPINNILKHFNASMTPVKKK